MDEEEYYEYGMANSSDADTYEDLSDSSENAFGVQSSGGASGF